MAKKGVLIKASVFYIIASVLQQGINFITTPFFTRLMATEEYGVVSVFNSWYGVISVFVTLMLWGGVFNNGMMDFPAKRAEFTFSIMQFVVVNGLLFSGLFALFQNFMVSLTQLPFLLLQYMLLRIVSDAIVSIWMAQKKYEYRYRSVFIVSVITAVANPVLGLLAVQAFPMMQSTAKIVASGLPSFVFAVLLLLYFLHREGVKLFTQYWKYALSFNIPLIPHYLANSILNQSDRIIISRLIGLTEAAVYSVGYSISALVNIIFSSINSSFVPYTYRCLKAKQFEKLSKSASMVLLVVAFVCLAIIALAPEIIFIMASAEYQHAIWCVPPIVFGTYCVFVYTLFANVEFYHKKNLFIMVASICAAVLNVVLNFLLIPIFGYVAAAYTTMFGYMALATAHYLFMRRITQTSIYNIRFILLVSAALFGLAGLAVVLYSHSLIRWLVITLVAFAVLFNIKRILRTIKMYIEEIRE